MPDEIKMVLKHPFSKLSAEDFIRESSMDPWLSEVAIARIKDETMPDNPRYLAKLIVEYIDLGLDQAKARGDAKRVCDHCQLGFALKSIIMSDEAGLMLCGEDCEYYLEGNSIKE